jgi:biotin carboxyl carrier protein
MQLTYRLGDEPITLDVEPAGDGITVRLPDGSRHRVRAEFGAGDVLELALDEGSGPARVVRMVCARTPRGTEISYDGRLYLFAAPSAVRSGAGGRKSSGMVAAPMSGTVVEVRVREGESVTAYQTLAVIEAMKVMAPLDAPFAGMVARVHVEAGRQVAHGAPIVEITRDDQPEAEQ